MPLLTSPIDGLPMEQISRFGIEIDRCKTSGGIWLDKGELEKLMVFLKEEAINDQSPPYRQSKEDRHSRPHYHHDYDDDDHDHDHDHYERGHEGKRKKSRMMDFFDF